MIHKERDHWAVTVERNGEKIVCIESNCLSGRELSAEDEASIQNAAEHLLSFIGVSYTIHTAKSP